MFCPGAVSGADFGTWSHFLFLEINSGLIGDIPLIKIFFPGTAARGCPYYTYQINNVSIPITICAKGAKIEYSCVLINFPALQQRSKATKCIVPRTSSSVSMNLNESTNFERKHKNLEIYLLYNQLSSLIHQHVLLWSYITQRTNCLVANDAISVKKRNGENFN